jgi:hypothetical protein
MLLDTNGNYIMARYKFKLNYVARWDWKLLRAHSVIGVKKNLISR